VFNQLSHTVTKKVVFVRFRAPLQLNSGRIKQIRKWQLKLPATKRHLLQLPFPSAKLNLMFGWDFPQHPQVNSRFPENRSRLKANLAFNSCCVTLAQHAGAVGRCQNQLKAVRDFQTIFDGMRARFLGESGVEDRLKGFQGD
jgi:hypothetical protein